MLRAGIAQLVECKLPKLDVAGSNPVARSREWFRPPGFCPGFFIMALSVEIFAEQPRVSTLKNLMDREFLSSLWAMIEPVLEPEGLELVEVEFKNERGRWVLRLYIDGPGGVTLDDCEMVSRQVGALLDVKDPFEQSYTLEVSSPGINRVLRREKDFRYYAGSPVRLRTRRKLDGRRNFQGVLLGLENAKIVLDVNGTRVEIEPEDIERARLDLPEEELIRRDLQRGAVNTGD